MSDETPDVEPEETPQPTDEDTRIADAAASALARARAGAAEKGLRPGMRPKKRRRPIGQAPVLSGSSRDGRDPALLGDQLDRLLLDRGWKVDVAVGSVMGRWTEIVGLDIAGHVEPLTFVDGVLTVTASEHRSQFRNREAARERMASILADAVAPPPKQRRPTKPSRGAVERRIAEKKRRAQTKRLRRSDDD